jgi:hypothetical protein
VRELGCFIAEDCHAYLRILLPSLACLDGEWHEYESKRERERTKRKEKRKLEAPLHPSTASVATEGGNKLGAGTVP